MKNISKIITDLSVDLGCPKNNVKRIKDDGNGTLRFAFLNFQRTKNYFEIQIQYDPKTNQLSSPSYKTTSKNFRRYAPYLKQILEILRE